MSDTSTNLTLPFLQAAQAQKHVTVNESLLRLDAVVQLSVVSATTSAQPASPVDGEVYILPAGKTGAAWGGMTNEALAYYRDGAWEQITPREGWIAYVRDIDRLRTYNGAAWVSSVAMLGASNTFAASQTLNLNTAAPLTPLSGTMFHIVAADGAVSRLMLDASATAPGVNFRRVNGTAAAPAALVGEDLIGFFTANGHDGVAPTSGRASVNFRATENWTASATGARMDFGVTANGSTTLTTRLTLDASGDLRPAIDNANSLGSGSFRFSTVYAASGAINTSDAREKTPLTPIPESVKRAVREIIARIGVFQWLDAIDRKGEDGARMHVGVTAQIVQEAFAAEGEDPGRWALFCADPLVEVFEDPAAHDAEGGPVQRTRPKLDTNGAPMMRLGVRTDQLMWLALAVIIASVHPEAD